MQRVGDASAQNLQPFVVEAVETGSVVHTDGWEGYTGLEQKGYRHEVTILKGRKEPAAELLPRVHLVASLLGRWLLGIHQGAVRHEYLDYYLDEFTFRFNRRTSRHRGKLFYRLLQAGGRDRPRTVSTNGESCRSLTAQTTSSCSHNLSQVHTQFSEFSIGIGSFGIDGS